MDKNLYVLTKEQEQLNALLEENGGELTPEMEAALLIHEDNANEVIEQYCKSIASYKAYAEALKTESKRLAEKAKAMEEVQDKLKHQILTYLLASGTKKTQAGIFQVSWTASQSTEILDEGLVPSEYKSEVVTIKIDKTAIKNAIKGGTDVPGAIVKDNKNLQIK